MKCSGVQRNTAEYSGVRVLSSAGWETRAPYSASRRRRASASAAAALALRSAFFCAA